MTVTVGPAPTLCQALSQALYHNTMTWSDEHYCHYYYVCFKNMETEGERGDRTHSQSLIQVGPLSSGPVSSPNLPLPIPRPHCPRWRRYQGKWTTWRACRPLTTTTLCPAGRAQIGAGSGSSPWPPLRPPRSLSARGSRPWQVPEGGLGWKEARGRREAGAGVAAGCVSQYLRTVMAQRMGRL